LKLFFTQYNVTTPVLRPFVATTHSQSVIRASLNTQAAEHTTPAIYLKFINHVIILAADMSDNFYIPLRASLGASGAAGTFVQIPDKLVASYAPGNN
jgi:hypothetical protein